MRIIPCLLLVFLFGSFANAQQTDCKVLITEISGSYSGGCKKGLADGKGIAEGVDHYEGQFTKGLPDGKGTYRKADGTYYEGQWSNGMRNGYGEMVYADSTVKGYWKSNKYVGKKYMPPYKITRTMNVTRSTITKSSDSENGVRIKIMQVGSGNSDISNLFLAHDSGNEFLVGNMYGIQNTSLPLHVKVTYTASNPVGGVSINVVFEFTINDPGLWNVTITN